MEIRSFVFSRKLNEEFQRNNLIKKPFFTGSYTGKSDLRFQTYSLSCTYISYSKALAQLNQNFRYLTCFSQNIGCSKP